MYFLETDRLKLKYIEYGDFWDIASMLKDKRVMYMTGDILTDEEINLFIKTNMTRYKKYGYGYFLAVDKHMNRPVGVMGIIHDKIDGIKQPSIIYILRREFWKKGYAKEGAQGLIQYAFSDLDVKKVISLIYFNNKPAIKTAESLNMKPEGSVLRDYKGIEVPYLIYTLYNAQNL